MTAVSSISGYITHLLPAQLIPNASYGPHTASDPYLRPGTVFNVPNNNISIQVQSVNTSTSPNVLMLQVNFN